MCRAADVSAAWPCLLKEALLLFPGQLSGLLWAAASPVIEHMCLALLLRHGGPSFAGEPPAAGSRLSLQELVQTGRVCFRGLQHSLTSSLPSVIPALIRLSLGLFFSPFLFSKPAHEVN